MKPTFALVTLAVAVSVFLDEIKATSRAQALHLDLRSTNLVKERDYAKAKDTPTIGKDFSAYGKLLEEAETSAISDDEHDKKVYLKEKEAHNELKSNSFVEKLESTKQRMSELKAPSKSAKRRLKVKKECPAGTVRCGNARSCISTSWICDGFDDCGDNWDEQNCCGEDSGCGTRVIKGGTHRIVGGENAARGAWPWQAQLYVLETNFECGGTLVGPRHVISAAHCFDYNASYAFARNWNVYFGKQDLSPSVGAGETVSAVKKLIIHENYNSSELDNDIAMMILAEDQAPSNTINFACLDLDHSKHFDDSSNCFSTGWGITTVNATGPAASQLQEAITPLVDHYTCNQAPLYAGLITNNMLCAGITTGGVGICKGDSGGPLVCSSKDRDSDLERWYLVGVTVGSIPCAHPNYPGVYVDVSKYTSWIQNHINSN